MTGCAPAGGEVLDEVEIPFRALDRGETPTGAIVVVRLDGGSELLQLVFDVFVRFAPGRAALLGEIEECLGGNPENARRDSTGSFERI